MSVGEPLASLNVFAPHRTPSMVSGDELRKLYELSTAVTRAKCLEDIYNLALDALTGTVGADRASILIYDSAGVMRFQAWRGISEEYRKAVDGHSPWTRDTKEAAPILVPDVSAEPTLAEYLPVFAKEKIAALGFIPLEFEGQLLGKFMVYYNAPHEFAPTEVSLVGTVANHIAFAIGRKQAEEKLALYKEIFLNSTDAIAAITCSGEYLEQNPAHRDMIGFSDSELKGRTPAIHFGQEAFDHIGLALSQGNHYRGEHVSVTKDGREIVIELVAFAVNDDVANPLCYVGIKRDITQRKRAEEQLRNMNATLEAMVKERTADLEFANHELEGFTYSIAHDMRQYLRSIVFESRTVLEDESENLSLEGKTSLRQLGHNATLASDLVTGLLELTRIGRKKLEVLPVNVSALAEIIAAELKRSVCKEAQISIQDGMTAMADERLLETVFHNLMDNACKFSKRDHPTVVRVGFSDGAFFVRDEGVGFDMQYEKMLFAPFQRLHRESEFPGTGIGLANVKRVVERHGGTVWAQSSPGEGATFFLKLPTP